jgi:putative ABC transport system ATP-binding protein
MSRGSGTSETASCIEVDDLRFAYPEGGFSLDIPTLTVERGRRVVFIGPSGSGKTTLLKLLAGILPPDSGRVIALGRDLGAIGDAQRRRFRIGSIGIIFQEFELLSHLTVRENILLPYYVNRALSLTTEVRTRVRDLADRLGIAPHLDRRPDVLSQGERQRVAVGRALVTRPEILMADEPTGNLDPFHTDSMMDLVLEEVRRREATFLMVTHDHGLLDRFDEVVDFADLLQEARV